MCGCFSCAPLLGTWSATQACTLDWELNQPPFSLQTGTQSTEPHQPGQYPSFLTSPFLMQLRFSLNALIILITSALNSASDRLLFSILFSSFSCVLVFFLLFGTCFSFWKPPCVCFYVLGRAATSVSQAW